jgi:predicted outer membrane lipoprotein
MPTLWALGVLLVGGILVLVVLTLTHMDAPAERTDAPVAPSAVVPAKPAAPPSACFPLAPC